MTSATQLRETEIRRIHMVPENSVPAEFMQHYAPVSGDADRIREIGGVGESELDAAVRSVQQQYASNPQQLPPENVLRRQVLERLVLTRLQVQHNPVDERSHCRYS